MGDEHERRTQEKRTTRGRHNEFCYNFFATDMSISPQHHQKQLQRQLLSDALGHGPYLWNDQDVNNALLWFPPETCDHSNSYDVKADDGKNVERDVSEIEGNFGIESRKKSGHEKSDTPDDATAHHAQSQSQPNSTIPHEIIQNESGLEFLRRLIQSRGIWMPRPPRLAPTKKEKKRKDSHTGKRGNGKEGSMEGRDRKSKRRKGSRGEKISGTIEANRSASDGTALANIGEKNSKSMPTKQPAQKNDPSPLPSILMGYYKLHDSPEEVISTPTEEADDESDYRNLASREHSRNDPISNNLDCDAAATSEKNATCQKNDKTLPQSFSHHSSMASTKLVDDLASIILERQHTNELYQEILHDCNRIPEDNDRVFSIGLGDDCTDESVRMNYHIDRYMTHPTTCIRRVYASSLYDRLVNLNSKGRGKEGKIAIEPNDARNVTTTAEAKINPSVDRYLQKLFGLAVTNDKIREVILLMILEPVRRLQMKASCTDDDSKTHGDYRRRNGFPTQPAVLNNRQESLCLVGHHSQAPNLDLFPLMTSSLYLLPSIATSSYTTSSFHNHNIAPKVIDKESSRPEITALVRLVIETKETSKQSKPSLVSQTPSHSIPWWSLPSPLLCTISQMHFSLACEYIRFWIDRALDGYNEAYDIHTVSGNIGTGASDFAKNFNMLFQQSIWRIRQFCFTSQRLSMLASQMLDAAGRDCSCWCEPFRGDSRVDDEKGVPKTDLDYHTSSALKAIRCRAFPDCISNKD